MSSQQPTTAEGRRELVRMGRATRLSKEAWDATSWLLKFLGASALFTIGLKLATESNQVELPVFGVLGLAAVLLGAFAFAVIQAMTQSRAAAANTAAQRRKLAYTILGVAFALQFGSLVASPIFQWLGVYDALRTTDARLTLNTQLADRLDLYSSDPRAIDLVRAYCTKHETDDRASSDFMLTCIEFNQSPPPSVDVARQRAAAPTATAPISHASFTPRHAT